MCIIRMQNITVMKGRFGPYLKFGMVNAKLPDMYRDCPEEIPLSEAMEAILVKTHQVSYFRFHSIFIEFSFLHFVFSFHFFLKFSVLRTRPIRFRIFAFIFILFSSYFHLIFILIEFLFIHIVWGFLSCARGDTCV